MFRIYGPLLLVATVVQSSHFHLSPLLGLSNPPAGVECVDNVCKIVPTSDTIKAEVIDLESKILKEWKAAGTAEPSTDSSTASVASSTVVDDQTEAAVAEPTSESAETESEPTESEVKVSELVKMGFDAEDAKIALKKANYEVSAAASILEADEEEKEDILKKVTELGEIIQPKDTV
jgi:hypothetical protein